jgi:hypothetical protein
MQPPPNRKRDLSEGTLSPLASGYETPSGGLNIQIGLNLTGFYLAAAGQGYFQILHLLTSRHYRVPRTTDYCYLTVYPWASRQALMARK